MRAGRGVRDAHSVRVGHGEEATIAGGLCDGGCGRDSRHWPQGGRGTTMDGEMLRTRLDDCRSLAALALAGGVLASGCLGGAPASGGAESSSPPGPGAGGGTPGTRAALPSPLLDGPVSLEEALAARRSVRSFGDAPLTPAEIGQLLWAAQGVTSSEGGRTAPSAGARYPLEVYAVTAAGIDRYLPTEHALERVASGDHRPGLEAAALGQAAVGEAPLVLVITAVPARTAERYGEGRAVRYVDLEAGHAAQNVLLQATALGLGAVPVGAFDDDAVARLLGLRAGESPRYLLPVGRPR